ncbi:hypothetical protein A7U43_16290 [Mycobacterium adipatum]|uniref:Uncharacterized protein n=1 Tax=Mycobacterium adipatum TaxID=1682113 RepID=A0A172UNY4_9MYCO|nr:hypothetical protein A7U43_16290 [Mycobacterium adipatum]
MRAGCEGVALLTYHQIARRHPERVGDTKKSLVRQSALAAFDSAEHGTVHTGGAPLVVTTPYNIYSSSWIDESVVVTRT